MRFFKPSWTKVVLTILLSGLLIFFTIPIVFQYCQPIEGDFGGGGCGPWNLPPVIYPIPPALSAHGDTIPAVNFIFYPLSQTLFQGVPQLTPPRKTASYPYSLYLSVFGILLSYIFSCLLVELMHKLRKKRRN